MDADKKALELKNSIKNGVSHLTFRQRKELLMEIENLHNWIKKYDLILHVHSVFLEEKGLTDEFQEFVNDDDNLPLFFENNSVD